MLKGYKRKVTVSSLDNGRMMSSRSWTSINIRKWMSQRITFKIILMSDHCPSSLKVGEVTSVTFLMFCDTYLILGSFLGGST